MTIVCEIVSQDKMVYEGDVDVVTVPTKTGQISILPGHAPLLSMLDLGVIRIKSGEQVEVFTVTGGFVEVQPEIVTILADAAEHVDDIDIKRAEEARERAKQLLEEGGPPLHEEYMKIDAALKRSMLRLRTADQYRKRGQRSRPPGMGRSE